MKRLLTAILALAPMVAGAAEHSVRITDTIAWTPGTPISFENLLGEVTVSSHAADQLIISVNVIANARQPNEAEALASNITLERDGNAFWMEYPTRDHSRFLYRTRGASTNTNTSYRGRRVSVTTRGTGADVQAYIHITVPHGTDITVANVVGHISADGTDAVLTLRSGSGRVETVRTQGSLNVNSVSGNVTIAHHQGAIEARTGSGNIRFEGAAVSPVALRTGSGNVRFEQFSGAGDLMVSTGSGSIRIEGNLAVVQRMRLTTGSGSIHATSSHTPNVRLEARSGSGTVGVEAPGMRTLLTERNAFEAVIGSGEGEARFITGSGSIRFTAP